MNTEYDFIEAVAREIEDKSDEEILEWAKNVLRHHALNEMVRLSQEMGLYDDDLF